MDFRRLLLALSLSFIFIFVWQSFFMPTPEVNKNDNKAILSDTVISEDLETKPVITPTSSNIVKLGTELNVKTSLILLDLNKGGTSIQN